MATKKAQSETSGPSILVFKGEVHPEVELDSIKAEKWDKHISEGLTKIHQR